MRSYDHSKIEKKWQKQWEKDGLYKTPDTAKGKENFYLLVEFPYPSGNLHVGHWYAFAVPDILARFRRMQGKNVLYPIGFDAFGLPAENAAIKNKLNPRTWTESNIEYMSKQIRSMGTSFDWSREVQTIDPEYYKWTQWMFLQFFKAGLVYRKETAVNWCPKDKTVLANEQVVNGHCERCDSEVVQKQMLQWNIKITDYADRLINDLDALDWPKEIKESQKNWIGRSEGAEIDFPLTIAADTKKYTYVILHGYTGKATDARWQWIRAELEGMGHTVIIPELPNTDDPNEKDQVAAALAAVKYDERTILVGHSLGGTVALKVLEKLQKPIARLVLVGSVINPKFKDKRRPFEKKFTWKFDAETIKRNAPVIQMLHDPRDYAISEEQREYTEKLLGIKAQICRSTEPHFTGDKEPDVLMWLRPTIRIFTTRADTLYGCTFLVLAPEHPWVTLALQHKTVLQNNDEVQKYVEQAKKKTEFERQTDQKEKTGVELKGLKAINPTTGKEVPVWVADYALMGFGTGALFGDAHDERDCEFAKKYGIPLKETIEPLTIRTSGPDTFREGQPFDERNAIIAIVKHWSEDTYLCLTSKSRNLNYFVCGGIDEGEDPVAAGKREIEEETGYVDAQFVRKLGGTIHSKFYQSLKKYNRLAHFTPLLFQLKDDTRHEIDDKEKAMHEVVWIDAEKVSQFINRDDVAIAWQRAQGNAVYEGKGILFGSGEYSGLTSDEALPKITERFGSRVVKYKLRDWIVSRQRYWGVPIPIVHCSKCGAVPVPDKDLPIELPPVKDYLPEGSGKSPLAKVKKFVETKCPQCKGKAERETDTLDTFVDSSWYFLRYTDPKNKKKFADAKKMNNWMPVDLYSGGAEHTTMHVLYSRFWQKALFDLGLVKDAEPYKRRMNRSIILGPDGQKMSKSRGNVVDPDEVVARLGADTVRMYLAFVGPYNEVSSFPWNPDSVVGVRRFLERVVRLKECISDEDVSDLEPVLHRTIKKVGDDIGALKFNTAISQLMIFLNHAEKIGKVSHTQWDVLIKLLAPFAPFLSEELWYEVGHTSSIHAQEWPIYDVKRLQEASVTIAVQINGKTRGQAHVDPNSDSIAQEAAASKAVAERLAGKKIQRTVVVPNRLVNFVVQE